MDRHPIDSQALREQNRRSWNMVVPAHYSHHRDLAAFLRAGGLTIFPEEQELLGDITGQSLVHLMCNTGQDTLSLARLGAKVIGIDISDEAIAIACSLAHDSALPAQFERADVFDWLAQAAAEGRRFNRVFFSYGTLCWISDLSQWAQGIAAILAPGGRFVVIDFHPTSNMFDAAWQLVRTYPAGGNLLTLAGIDDYVGASGAGLTPSGFTEGVREFHNPEPCHLFQWGVGEVVTALAQAGLRIETLREYLFVNGERPFTNMREGLGRRLIAPEGTPQIPLMYAVTATH